MAHDTIYEFLMWMMKLSCKTRDALGLYQCNNWCRPSTINSSPSEYHMYISLKQEFTLRQLLYIKKAPC